MITTRIEADGRINVVDPNPGDGGYPVPPWAGVGLARLGGKTDHKMLAHFAPASEAFVCIPAAPTSVEYA